MKTILEISKTQLRRFFFSPIAWLVLLTILILLGYQFTSMLELREGFWRRFGSAIYLTREIYKSSGGASGGVLPSLLNGLYLFLPLLSMGLISADLANGSIKLMYSSPIKTWHFVLGKYLASVVFSFLITVCIGLVMLPGFFIIKDFEVMFLICACLGIFLLSCTYMAIGLFISSLSSNQIVVAIATFIILGFLNYADMLWQDIPVLGNVMFWMGMPVRAEVFVEGLLSTQNTIYFLNVIMFFNGLTYLRLAFMRNRRTPLFKLSVYTIFSMLVLLIGVVSSNPYLIGYYDMTNNKRNTLSEKSQKIVKQLKNVPLEMNVYANIFDHNVGSALPGSRNKDKRIFQRFTRFLPQLKFNYFYFYAPVSDNPAIFKENPTLDMHELGSKIGDSYGLSQKNILKPSEISELVDLSEEDNQYIREVSANGNSQFLRMYNGIFHFPAQQHTAGALRNLVEVPLQVAILTGSGERSVTSNKESDYKNAFSARVDNGQNALLNLGFTDFTEIPTDSANFNKEKLLKSDILVIADPREPYSYEVVNAIIEYIKNGGDMMLTLEPDANTSLQKILDALGINQVPGTLLDLKNTDFEKDLMLAKFDSLSPLLPNNFIKDWLWRYEYPVTMPKTSGLKKMESSPFEAHPFLIVDSVKTSVDTISIKPHQKISLALTLSRSVNNKTQKIFITGDADFVSNKELERGNISNYNDKDLLPYIFHWFTDGELPVDVTILPGPDDELFIAKEPGQTVFQLQLVFMGLVPLIVVGSGASLLIKRNRR